MSVLKVDYTNVLNFVSKEKLMNIKKMLYWR